MVSISRQGPRASLSQSAAKTLFSNKNGCNYIFYLLIFMILVIALCILYRLYKNYNERHIIERDTNRRSYY